ncbi:MAG: site-specific integrase [Planctomycetota bacterium]|nr:site-specific integrase [Planctomycetota bacterium]
MDSLQQKLDETLQLAGYSERSRECYVRQLRMFEEFYHRSAGEVTEDELKQYLLHRQNVDNWSSATMRIAIAGLRQVFEKVLARDWPALEYVRAPRETKLPVVLSVEQVSRIVSSTYTFHNQVYLATVYSCGLRLHESLSLQVTDIHANRQLIHVHRGKGAKDRMVPLPHRTLEMMREYWKTHRNPKWIFPRRGHRGTEAPMAQIPMHCSTPQGALRRVLKELNISYRGVSIHTFRHCYATHLLEAGVNVHQIQKWMGHANLEYTLRYLHLTSTGQANAYQVVDRTISDVLPKGGHRREVSR